MYYQDRICRFGNVVNNEMVLNKYGYIANDEFEKLSERFPNFKLDILLIMPNHIHGIILIVGATHEVAQNVGVVQNDSIVGNDLRAGASPAPAETDGYIVGAYKSLAGNGF